MTDQADSYRLRATVGIRAEVDARFYYVVSACGYETNAYVSFTILDCSQGRQNGAVHPARAKCTRIDECTQGCEGYSGGYSWNRGLSIGDVKVIRVHVERLDDEVGDTDVWVTDRHLVKYNFTGMTDGGAAVVRSIDESGRQVVQELRQHVSKGVAATQDDSVARLDGANVIAAMPLRQCEREIGCTQFRKVQSVGLRRVGMELFRIRLGDEGKFATHYIV